jgi:hypothetical protein
VSFQAERLRIYSRSLATGRPLDTISFELEGPTEIHIENGDPRDIRNHLEGLSVADSKPKKADADFELYYTILAPDEDDRLPIPIVQPDLLLVRDCYVVMTDFVDEPA